MKIKGKARSVSLCRDLVLSSQDNKQQNCTAVQLLLMLHAERVVPENTERGGRMWTDRYEHDGCSLRDLCGGMEKSHGVNLHHRFAVLTKRQHDTPLLLLSLAAAVVLHYKHTHS